MPAPRTITPHQPAAPLMAGAFAQGPDYTNWRPHGSGDWLLIHTTGGGGLVTTPDGTHRLGEGEIVLFRPDASQAYATHPGDGHWNLQWVHFHARPEWHARLPRRVWAPGVIHHRLRSAETRTALTAALDRLIAVRRQAWTGATDLALNALEEALLWIETDASDDPHWRIDPRIRQASDELTHHPERPFDLGQLARQVGLSRSRLSHLFKAQTDQSPQAFAEQVKLRLAQELLLHSSLPIAEVARATGFEDALYFSKRFRRLSGASPSSYRADHAGSPRAKPLRNMT